MSIEAPEAFKNRLKPPVEREGKIIYEFDPVLPDGDEARNLADRLLRAFPEGLNRFGLTMKVAVDRKGSQAGFLDLMFDKDVPSETRERVVRFVNENL